MSSSSASICFTVKICEKRQASSEVDYLQAYGRLIFPVEVKSGKTGKLKSLQVFLRQKELNLGVRFNADIPSFHEAKYSLPGTADSASSKTFNLLSLPLYMVEELERIVRSL